MDRERFDAITRLLATTPSRRSALTALLGAGLAGILGEAEARNNRRQKRRKTNRKKRRNGREKNRDTNHGGEAARVNAEAVHCQPPRPNARLVSCDYSGDDLDGAVLHSSNLKNAKFIETSLIEADVHASTLTGADFTGANLCGANLSSSALRKSDFTDANLTRATLRASGVGGWTTTGATFCRTRMPNGAMNNSGCPGAATEDICCTEADCGPNRLCVSNVCVPCTVCLEAGACDSNTVADAVANALPGAAIHICPGRYHTVNVEIDTSLTLIGAGAGDTTLDAEDDGRVFRIDAGPTGSVRIEDLTITGGNALGISGDAFGGGIRVVAAADVTLVGVVVTGNTAKSGGGILSNVDTSTLTLEASQVTLNEALAAGAGEGGGIWSIATLTLGAGSNVTLNKARFGGGIFNSAAGDLILESGSSVTGNDATIDGGGISTFGEATLRDGSSVVDNEAGGNGGGINNLGALTLDLGSSVTENRAADGGGIFNAGGDITNNGDVSANTPTNCDGAPAVPNCPS